MGKAWEHELTRGGRKEKGPIFEYAQNKLESEFFLLVKTSIVSITLTSGIQDCGRALKRMPNFVIILPPPPYVHFAST